MDTRLSRILSITAMLLTVTGICMVLWSVYNMYLVLSYGNVPEAFQMLFDGNLEIRRTMTNDLVVFMDRNEILTIAQITLWILAAYGSFILFRNSIKLTRSLGKFKEKPIFDQIVVVLMVTTGTALTIYFYHNLGEYYYSPVALKSSMNLITGSNHNSLHGTSEPEALAAFIIIAAQFTLIITAYGLQKTFSFSNRWAEALAYIISLVGLCAFIFSFKSIKSAVSQYTLTFNIPYAFFPFFLLLCFLWFVLLALYVTLNGAVKIILRETPLFSSKLADSERRFRERF
jgi:hypothetical protein